MLERATYSGDKRTPKAGSRRAHPPGLLVVAQDLASHRFRVAGGDASFMAPWLPRLSCLLLANSVTKRPGQRWTTSSEERRDAWRDPARSVCSDSAPVCARLRLSLDSLTVSPCLSGSVYSTSSLLVPSWATPQGSKWRRVHRLRLRLARVSGPARRLAQGAARRLPLEAQPQTAAMSHPSSGPDKRSPCLGKPAAAGLRAVNSPAAKQGRLLQASGPSQGAVPHVLNRMLRCGTRRYE
jgi:hypothetical protein